MNTIKQLIDKYCPDGVEYKKLGEVCTFQRGTSLTSKNAIEGDIPVISGGQKPAFYHNVANREANSITVAGSGAYAGYVSFWNKPIFAADCFTVNPDCSILLIKYVYHYLLNIQEKIYGTKKGAGVPHVHGNDIAKFLIPVPPLPVQHEIVRILDSFTSLEAELEAELKARRKQYEYYRDQLLSFKHLIGGGKNEVEWKTLGEVFEMRNGYTPSKSHSEFWEGGTIPWFRMEDIRKNGRKLSDSILHITDKGLKGKGLFDKGTFILATTATIGEHALLIVDSLANQRFTNLKIRKSLVNSLLVDFVFYYLFIVDEFCKRHTNKSGFESVDMKALSKMPFPIPPLSTQRRIVSILDRFESLVNDITTGLPAEIAARHQQYEYYRDQLLSFKRKS